MLVSRYILRVGVTLIAIAAILVSSVGVSTSAHASDEFDALRARWNVLLTGAGTYSPSDSDVAARIASIDADAGVVSTMATTPTTRLWPDLDSVGNPQQMVEAFNRVRSIALAYATTGSSYYNSSSVFTKMITGLDWLRDNTYNSSTTPVAGNWWWQYQIGVPLALTDIHVLLYDQMDATRRTSALNAIAHFVTPLSGADTAANRIWKSTITMLQGVLSKSASLMVTGRDGLTPVFNYVVSGSEGGFMLDGSYVQHTYFSYLGGYGGNYLDTLSRALYLLAGSTWAVTSPLLTNVYDAIDSGVRPLIFRGAVMDMTRGRNASRQSDEHAAGHLIIQAVTVLTLTASGARAATLKSLVKEWVQEDTFSSVYSDATIFQLVTAKAIVADPSVVAATEINGYRQYAGVDQAVVRRAGYAFGVSMSSSRIANFETDSTGAENKNGWYTSDGATSLYNSDLGQFSGDYHPTIDPYRRPGTTVDTTLVRSASSSAGYRSPNSWAGGTSLLGQYGASGMDLKAAGNGSGGSGNSLVAKKSWFMFGDNVVALGAGITSTNAGDSIETTIENRKVDAAGTITVDGTTAPGGTWSTSMTPGSSSSTWAQFSGPTAGDNIGYYIPGAQSVRYARSTRSGTWTGINGFNTDSSTKSASYGTISLLHGVTPTNASYAYVLLPGKTATQTATFASAPTTTILSNTSTLQAAKDTVDNIVAANTWSDASTTVAVGGSPFVTVDRKSSVMTKESTARLDVSVADPTQANTGTINVEINRAAFGVISHDPRIVVTQLSPTVKFTAYVKGAAGGSLEASFGFASGAPIDTNYAFGVTPAVSSATGSAVWAAANLSDGYEKSTPTSMGWSSNNSLTTDHSESVTYDLGTARQINTVDLFPARFGGEASMPGSVQIKTSVDGTTWTSAIGPTSVSSTSTPTRLSFPAVAAQWVQIIGTSLNQNPNDGNRYRMQLAEVEIRDVDVALGAGVPSVTSSYGGSGWGTAKAVDGFRGSSATSYGWSSNSSTSTDHRECIVIDLGAPRGISSLTLSPVMTNGGYGYPASMVIEISTTATTCDASATGWTSVWSQTGIALPSGPQQIGLSPTTATYVRISGTQLRPNPQDLNLYRMQFAEIEVY